VHCLEQIIAAANDPDRWQAAAWILERRYPESYGRRGLRLAGELDGCDGRPDGPIKITEIVVNLPSPDAPLTVPYLDVGGDDEDTDDDLPARR
jgi:hypothetical protein